MMQYETIIGIASKFEWAKINGKLISHYFTKKNLT